MLPQVVIEKLEGLPPTPGVYLFRDKKGAVVYVGKAKSLRSRVRSYFQESSSDERYFIPTLLATIGDLETFVTATEKEAAILENNLIKEHLPRFNIKLRDGKEYISLRLDPDEAWPRLRVVRKPVRSPKDKARVFGPFPSATAARRTLHLVNKHFQLRTCTDVEMRSRKRPCLQYQIKRCPAPCVLEVDKVFYDEQVNAVCMFLDGRHDELSKHVEARMRDAARAMQFELAAVYRDQRNAIEKVRESQRIVTSDPTSRDVVGLFREGDLVELAVLSVRHGRLARVATFSLKAAELPDEEVIGAFLAQHYAVKGHVDEVSAQASDAAERHQGHPFGASAVIEVPDEIVVPVLPDAAEGTSAWLSEQAEHAVRIVKPQRGVRAELLRLANENASHAFAEKRRAADDVMLRLAQLQERLKLPTLPRRIECCDISHLGGRDTVGAVVALLDGEPDKSRYRVFHVRGLRDAGGEAGVPADDAQTHESLRPEPDDSPVDFGGDDYRAMYEVLSRRFQRAKSDESSVDWSLPDVFVVDGGRGQLGVALAAARDLGLVGLPIVALAKEKENVAGETLVDRVYLPGQKNPIALKSHSASMFFLARARDEAHRFSNRARERLGKRQRFFSELDAAPGVGKKTKQALLQHLGSLKAIKEASDEAILAVPGVTSRHLRALREAFGMPGSSAGAQKSGR